MNGQVFNPKDSFNYLRYLLVFPIPYGMVMCGSDYSCWNIVQIRAITIMNDSNNTSDSALFSDRRDVADLSLFY